MDSTEAHGVTVETSRRHKSRAAMRAGGINGSDPDRDPVPDGASDTEAARSLDGGSPRSTRPSVSPARRAARFAAARLRSPRSAARRAAQSSPSFRRRNRAKASGRRSGAEATPWQVAHRGNDRQGGPDWADRPSLGFSPNVSPRVSLAIAPVSARANPTECRWASAPAPWTQRGLSPLVTPYRPRRGGSRLPRQPPR